MSKRYKILFCKNCNTELVNVHFNTRFCKACKWEHKRNWSKFYQRDITRRKYASEWSRKNKYGLTKEQTLELFEQQTYKCAICFADTALLGRGSHVDHNHLTGKVRGVLCTRCNLGLGYFKDNKEMLALAIEYLKKYDE